MGLAFQELVKTKKIVSSYATNKPKTQKVKKIKTKQTSNFIATFFTFFFLSCTSINL
jgi:ribosomal protein S17E